MATSPRKKVILSVAALAGVGVLATTAAFTDFANLNLGNGADGSGIGGGAFNIQVVGTDADNLPVPGTWQEADTAQGVDIAVPGADTITPGDTISVEIPYLNDSATLGADIAVWMNEVPGKTSDATYLGQLRFTVKDATGTAITGASNLTFDAFNELSEAANLTPTALAAGADSKLTLEIKLESLGDDAANQALNGGTAYVQLHFDATSVAP